jgi:hypothetical protein
MTQRTSPYRARPGCPSDPRRALDGWETLRTSAVGGEVDPFGGSGPGHGSRRPQAWRSRWGAEPDPPRGPWSVLEPLGEPAWRHRSGVRRVDRRRGLLVDRDRVLRLDPPGAVETLTGPADASVFRVRLHTRPSRSGGPLFSLHPGASRCPYLVTRLRFPGGLTGLCLAVPVPLILLFSTNTANPPRP